MKIKVKTTRTGDFRPGLFDVPQEIALEGGPALSAWISKCSHSYRSEQLVTTAEVITEEGDLSIVTTFIKNAQVAKAGAQLLGET